jgi:hypothetical protein
MTSASTLSRRARAEKNPTKAKKLRAKAAALRRKARMEHAIKTGQHSGIVVGLNPIHMERDEAANDSNAARAASVDHLPLVRKPWYETEEQIAELLGKAKKPEEFKRELANMLASSRFDGRTKALQERDGEAAEINKTWRINIVAAFIAKAEAMEKMHRGLPRTIVVDGMTAARIVDALRDAGYTAEGFSGRPQWRAVSR